MKTPFAPKSLEERIENFLDNDLSHLRSDITKLNTKMWFVLLLLVGVFLVVISPLVQRGR